MFEILNWLTHFQQSVHQNKAQQHHDQSNTFEAHTLFEKDISEVWSMKMKK